METTNIYVLKDPRTNEVRYIGKANNPVERYRNHNNKGRDKNTHKRNWINELWKNKLKPILEIIDTVPIDKWKEYEKFYIKKYINDGCDLVNYTDGGDGATFANATSFKPGNGARKVVMLDKNGTYLRTFDMIKDAEEFVDIKTNGVMQVLIKRNKTCKGFLFIYEDEYKNMTSDDVNKIVKDAVYIPKANNGSFKKGDKPKNIKKTYQFDKKGNFIKEWDSAAEAQRELKLKGGVINCAIGTAKSAGGYFWSYDITKNKYN